MTFTLLLFVLKMTLSLDYIHSDQVLEMIPNVINVNESDTPLKVVIIPPKNQDRLSGLLSIQFWIKSKVPITGSTNVFHVLFNTPAKTSVSFSLSDFDEFSKTGGNNFSNNRSSPNQFVKWNLVEFEIEMDYSSGSTFELNMQSYVNGITGDSRMERYKNLEFWKVDTVSFVLGNDSLTSNSVTL